MERLEFRSAGEAGDFQGGKDVSPDSPVPPGAGDAGALCAHGPADGVRRAVRLADQSARPRPRRRDRAGPSARAPGHARGGALSQAGRGGLPGDRPAAGGAARQGTDRDRPRRPGTTGPQRPRADAPRREPEAQRREPEAGAGAGWHPAPALGALPFERINLAAPTCELDLGREGLQYAIGDLAGEFLADPSNPTLRVATAWPSPVQERAAS